MSDLLKSKKFQLGFTLIELLIVVTIIVVLISIGAVSYTTVNRNARDAQRKSDLARIQQALEEFKADNGSYPSEGWVQSFDIGDPGDEDVMTCGTGGGLPAHESDDGAILIFTGFPFTCNGRTYMSKVPGDPLNNTGYYYETHEGDDSWCPGSSNSECQKYTLLAKLEGSDPMSTSTDSQCREVFDEPSPEGSFIETNFNYCVHQP